MSLRQQLRVQTAADHKSLDVFIEQMDVFASLTHYGRYLCGMHELDRTYGPAVDQASQQIGIPPSSAGLMTAIDSDLKAIGQDDTDLASSVRQWHSSPKPPTDTASQGSTTINESDQWAAAYVMEGAAMGARMMKRTANQLVALKGARSNESSGTVAPKTVAPKTAAAPKTVASETVAAGTAYLTKLAEDSYERWPKVVAALDLAKPAKADIVASSKQIFLLAKNIFEAIASEARPNADTHLEPTS